MESIEETWARIAHKYPFRVQRSTVGAPSALALENDFGRDVFVRSILAGTVREYAFLFDVDAVRFETKYGGVRCDA